MESETHLPQSLSPAVPSPLRPVQPEERREMLALNKKERKEKENLELLEPSGRRRAETGGTKEGSGEPSIEQCFKCLVCVTFFLWDHCLKVYAVRAIKGNGAQEAGEEGMKLAPCSTLGTQRL